jgi:putative endonuclease
VGNANSRKGRFGEVTAIRFLEEQGHRILERNWKYRRVEIDIISVCGQTLHFTEVKTRFSNCFGLPESAVHSVKLNRLKLGAEAYLEEHPQWQRISFDVLAICIRGQQTEIRHFLDLS